MMVPIHIIIEMVITAFKRIKSPRFFKTERGFQGRLNSVLNRIQEEQHIFPDGTIIEEEYQKKLDPHGMRQRPDIIIHVPIESGHSNNRKENNYVVFALKLNARKNEVMKDFKKLDEVIEKLNYQFGIFININSINCFLEEYQGPNNDKLHEFCIKQINGNFTIHYAYLHEDNVIITKV